MPSKTEETQNRRFIQFKTVGVFSLAPSIHEVNALPSHYAAVVRLRCAKKRYTEIAEALSIPVGTVRSRLSRARDAILKSREPQLNAEAA
jgi:hypothetical protein